MTIVVLLVVVAVVGAVLIVLLGKAGEQAEFPPDRPNFELPERALVKADVDAVRFSVGLRGYRMDQVDVLIDRLAAELEDRDRQLAQLRGEEPHPQGEPFVEDSASAARAAAANDADAIAAGAAGPEVVSFDSASADDGPATGSDSR